MGARQRSSLSPWAVAATLPGSLIRPAWLVAATRDENRVARPSSAFLGAREPVDKTDAGAFPAPRTVAVSTRFSVVSSVGPAGRHPNGKGGVDGGAAGRAVRRVGCRQGRGGGLCAGPRRAWWTSPGGADVPDLHLRVGGAGWVAGRRGRHPGGDGGHRPILEARLVCPGGGGLGAVVGQRPARQDPARPQDRRLRCRLAGGTVGARAAAGQLRAPGPHPRAARPDALPQAADPGSRLGGPADPEDPGGCWHQAGLGRHRCAGRLGRAMLAALVAGERDPQVLAELAKGRLRAKLPQLRQALRAAFGPTMRSLSASPWRTWSSWRLRSPSSTPTSTGCSPRSPRPGIGWTPSPGWASGPPRRSSPRSAST